MVFAGSVSPAGFIEFCGCKANFFELCNCKAGFFEFCSCEARTAAVFKFARDAPMVDLLTIIDKVRTSTTCVMHDAC